MDEHGASNGGGAGPSPAALAGRRVVVTGGASFIGGHLCRLLDSVGATVVAVDDLSSGDRANLEGVAAELVEADLRLDGVARELVRDADVVVHLAARHGGRAYVDTHPVECVGNVALDHRVFEACAAAGVGNVVFASSACVYPVLPAGDPAAAEPLEEDAAGFEQPGAAFADGEYGWAKLYSELQLAAFAKAVPSMSWSICRLFNVYGPRENETHAMVALADRVVERRDPFEIWGDGRQRRCFTHVTDVVRALALASTTTGHHVLNVASPRVTTVDELAELMFEIDGWRPQAVQHRLDAPVGAQDRVAAVERAATVLGWRTEIDLEAGVAAVLAERRAAHARAARA